MTIFSADLSDRDLPSDFLFDSRLTSSSFHLLNWPLSGVFLKNNAGYPWFILVPRRTGMQDIMDFTRAERYQLMDEIAELSAVIRGYFKPDKLNTAALGNIVPQYHVHIVARFQQDALWPHGIWQTGLEDKPYTDVEPLLNALRLLLSFSSLDTNACKKTHEFVSK